MTAEPGVVLISLDTELAWGCFDTAGVPVHREAYEGTRSVVAALCDLFVEYEVSATWAFVAHLLEDCGGGPHADLPDPGFEWVVDWYDALPCRSGVERDLWYAPDLLAMVMDCAWPQEVGLHGYTHMVLGEGDCPEAAARTDLRRAVDVAEDAGLDPTSFVYPRNRIGHRRVLSEQGLDVYRSPDAHWFERRSLPATVRKALRFLTEARMATPPAVTPRTVDGLVAIPGSQVLRPYHGGWQHAPDRSRAVRGRRGVERAAETGGIYHLWFHPFNLALEPERSLDALEEILATVDRERRAGRIEVMNMTEVAAEFRDGRWGGSDG